MSTENTRGLSSEFREKLKEGGKWNFITEEVKKDHTLHFQIRDNYINIYYRGCSILNLDENGKVCIDKKYHEEKIEKICEWKKELPNIKQGVDHHLSEENHLEREFQQLVARDNTFSKVSNGTDYFIVDTEMADTKNGSRFDMLAIKWLSTSAARKVDKTCRLAIIEMKFGTEAFGNLESHFNHIDQYSEIESLKGSILVQFKQLRELGLIQFSSKGNKNEVTKLEGDVEFIVLLANYDPNSTIINEHLSFMKKMHDTLKEKNITLKFATSSFMGYGLYEERMLSLDEFEKLLKK